MALNEVLIAQSERLSLRVYEQADSAALFDIVGSPETMRLMPRGLMEDEPSAREWIEQRRVHQERAGYSIWAVTLRSTGRLIGNCGFTGERDEALELGYVLNHSHWGQGYATEAASAAVAYGFEHLGASSIIATIRPGNDPSIAVAERLGMHQIGSTADEHDDLLVFRLDCE